MKHTILTLFGVIATIALLSFIVSQDAFAHGRAEITKTISNGESRTIQVVLGHVNEPTYGNEPGTWDGIHGVDITIRDKATLLPISVADLKVDKYYFKNQKKVDKASNVKDADEKELGAQANSIFGQPGKFIVRQVVTDGIYGYRVYGSVTYFDNTVFPVDFTGFCEAGSKFNKGFIPGYGCVDSIQEIKFPKKGKSSNNFNKDD